MSSTDRYTFIPIEEITKPPNGLNTAYQNFYWVVNDKNEVAVFRGNSPIANPHKEVAVRGIQMVPGAVGIVLIEQAYLPARLADYIDDNY